MDRYVISPALAERLDWLLSSMGGVRRALDNSADCAELREFRGALEELRFKAMSLLVDSVRSRRAGADSE
ncbi:MAG: hypothetical protein ACE5EF_00005 [Dehalococcoidia bacterium]